MTEQELTPDHLARTTLPPPPLTEAEWDRVATAFADHGFSVEDVDPAAVGEVMRSASISLADSWPDA